MAVPLNPRLSSLRKILFTFRVPPWPKPETSLWRGHTWTESISLIQLTSIRFYFSPEEKPYCVNTTNEDLHSGTCVLYSTLDHR